MLPLLVMVNKTQNKRTGDMGEAIVCQYLENKGFTILDRNYRVPQAEIDIVARETETIHFVEVKTVSYETKEQLQQAITSESWRPEEQVHAAKLKKLGMGAEAWIMNHGYTGNWQIDVAAVRLVPRETYATVKLIDNVIVE